MFQAPLVTLGRQARPGLLVFLVPRVVLETEEREERMDCQELQGFLVPQGPLDSLVRRDQRESVVTLGWRDPTGDLDLQVRQTSANCYSDLALFSSTFETNVVNKKEQGTELAFLSIRSSLQLHLIVTSQVPKVPQGQWDIRGNEVLRDLQDHSDDQDHQDRWAPLERKDLKGHTVVRVRKDLAVTRDEGDHRAPKGLQAPRAPRVSVGLREAQRGSLEQLDPQGTAGRTGTRELPERLVPAENQVQWRRYRRRWWRSSTRWTWTKSPQDYLQSLVRNSVPCGKKTQS